MKYCGNCGKPQDDDALFCANCGQRLMDVVRKKRREETVEEEEETAEKKSQSGWVDDLGSYMGHKGKAELNWSALFSNVFESHTHEEAESIFICGTEKTTPAESDVKRDWPRPWLYSRVLVMMLLAYLLLWLCCEGFSNLNALPGLIVVGSFAVPLATLVLFLEVNAWRNVSVYEVMQVFLVGGCLSMVATLTLFSIYPVEELDYWGALMVGLIEEFGKAIVAYIFLRRLCKLSVLTGMLIGAAVGAGFAAFESAGYAMKPILAYLPYIGYATAQGEEIGMDSVLEMTYEIIRLRGFLAPGGHVAWAAISGAGIEMAAKANKEISFSLLLSGKFWRLFIIPVLLHAAWDCPLASEIGASIYLVPILLLVAVWVVVMILINMGLAELPGNSNHNTQ